MTLSISIFLCKRFFLRNEWSAVPSSEREDASARPPSECRAGELAAGMIFLSLLVLVINLVAATLCFFFWSTVPLFIVALSWMLLLSAGAELCIIMPVYAISKWRENKRRAGSAMRSAGGHADFASLVSDADIAVPSAADSKPGAPDTALSANNAL
jgi:uncharacterized integral membrane protein